MWEYNQTNTLAHHGILGMHWGHRRTRTTSSAGSSAKKMPDDKLQSEVKRMNLEKQYRDLSKENKPVSKVEKTKKVVDSASSLINQAKSINRDSIKSSRKALDLSKMTDQQLRERINRSNLEKQYNDMFGSEGQQISKGRQRVSKILEYAGTTLALGSSALGIAVAIKELKK
jgi:hypothetical protein